MNKDILIVEDDEDISMIEEAYISNAGYHCQVLNEGSHVLEMMAHRHFDLVLLDVMLPGESGFSLCQKIRDVYNIPIILVTARGETIDKIHGLGIGADDYIVKPFDPSELLARINAHLRTYERLATKTSKEKTIVSHGITIYPESYRVEKNGEELKLPKREFELLVFLASHPMHVFSKEELFEKIWGYDYNGDQATVMVHINRLRERLEDDPKHPEMIETIWGAGYRFRL